MEEAETRALIEDFFKSVIILGCIFELGEGLLNRVISAIIFTLLLTGMLAFASFVQPANAEFGTIYIRADGSIDPPTAPIQRNGDVYTLTDNIEFNITRFAPGIVVEKDNILIEGSGFAIVGNQATASYGIYLEGRKNITILHMNIRNFGFGIKLNSRALM